jgi:predicted acyl esterase
MPSRCKGGTPSPRTTPAESIARAPDRNKGHKIAVHVSSSDSPAYEAHPNTFEPVASIDKAAVAKNTVHLSADHASKVILPVIAKELYEKK